MAFAHFSHQRVLQLHEAAVARGLAQQQPALLEGIAQAFCATLPDKPDAPSNDRLLTTLHRLNACEVLTDGSVPLMIWLGNAVRLTGEETLRAALSALPGGAAYLAGTSGTPALHGENLTRYLAHVEARFGTVILAGLLGDKSAPVTPVQDVYVSIDVTFPERMGSASASDHEGVGRGHDPLTLLAGALEGEEREPAQDPELYALLMSALSQVGIPEEERASKVTAVWNKLQSIERTRDAVGEALARSPVEEAVRRASPLLLEGAPGSGKTTVLQHVAMALAYAHRGDPERALTMGFVAPWPIPIVVVLRRFGVWLGELPKTTRDAGGASLLLDYLASVVGPLSGGAAWIAPAISAGRAVVLLDGLDEIADPYLRESAADVVRDLVVAHPRGRFVLASRPAGLSALTRRVLTGLGKFTRAQVMPLDKDQIERFVQSWYVALLRGNPLAESKAADLVERIRRAEELGKLAETPILLTAIAVIHHDKGELPERRAELYERCVQSLVHLWQKAKDTADGPFLPSRPGELSLDQKVGILQEAAFEIQCLGGAQTLGMGRLCAFAAARVKGRVGVEPEPEECRVLIEDMAERSGLLVPDRDGEVRFRHLQFQEFLAARWICVEMKDRIATLASRLADPAWREVVSLAPAFKALSDKPEACAMVVGLIDRAAQMEPKARGSALALISKVIVDLGAYDVRDLGLVVDQFAKTAISLLDDRAQPAAMNDRVAIVGVLARTTQGDPRLIDDKRWIDVPKGPYWRGAVKGDKVATVWEKPGGIVEVSAFKVARWPVTIGEYRHFVAAKGYHAQEHWSRGGWAFRNEDNVRAPMHWDAQLRAPHNTPVVGVSWWEAEAYCAWMTSKMATSLPRGWVVRLPTEAEWEKAARGGGSERRIYPWGDTWDVAKANVWESEIRKPTPVGCFPGGQGVYGAWDQAGNVWEWSLDYFDPKMYQRPQTKNPRLLNEAEAPLVGSTQCRGVRGGGWLFGARFARVSYREGFGLWGRDGDLGFRCVMACRPEDL